MSALIWGDERPTLAQYRAVREVLESRCAELPDHAFRDAWRCAVRELSAGRSGAMAITVAMQKTRCWRQENSGGAA